MLSEKPWKSEAILRLGLSLFLCQFLGALGLAVARFFSADRPVKVWIFSALATASAVACGAALFLIRKPWPMDRFTRQFLFLIFFVYLGMTFGAFVSHFAGPSDAGQSAVRAIIAIVSFQGVALIFIHRFLREHGMDWQAGFGFSTGWLKAVLYGALVACAFLPIGIFLKSTSAEVLTRLHVPFQPQAAVQALGSSTSWLERAALGLLATGLVPIAEEALFRGLLYPVIKQAGFPRLALWGNSLLFAAIHLDLAAFLPLLLLALVLTRLYETTDNLLAPIAAHATFNALQFSLFYLVPLAAEKFDWLRRIGLSE